MGSFNNGGIYVRNAMVSGKSASFSMLIHSKASFIHSEAHSKSFRILLNFVTIKSSMLNLGARRPKTVFLDLRAKDLQYHIAMFKSDELKTNNCVHL